MLLCGKQSGFSFNNPLLCPPLLLPQQVKPWEGLFLLIYHCNPSTRNQLSAKPIVIRDLIRLLDCFTSLRSCFILRNDVEATSQLWTVDEPSVIARRNDEAIRKVGNNAQIANLRQQERIYNYLPSVTDRWLASPNVVSCHIYKVYKHKVNRVVFEQLYNCIFLFNRIEYYPVQWNKQ